MNRASTNLTDSVGLLLSQKAGANAAKPQERLGGMRSRPTLGSRFQNGLGSGVAETSAWMSEGYAK
jgi:hypothetical protein